MTESEDPKQEALRREALDWLSRMTLGEASQEDLAELRRWRDTSPAHATALAEAGRLWRSLEVPVTALVRDNARDVEVARRPSRRAFLAVGAAAAASVAGAMVVRPPLDLWPSLAELAADHRTGIGQQQHLVLAKAVSVDLNTLTSISVRAADLDPGIELIAGETAIAIGADAPKPFVVLAGGGRMTARRATFDVRRIGPAVDLTCVDGEVTVECESRTLVLQTAQRVSYGRQGLGEIAAVDTAMVTAWRDGMIVFRNTPLVDVIEEVNRYRSGRIILLDSALGRRLVTARFEIKRLDTVMGQIAHVFDARVRTFPGGL